MDDEYNALQQNNTWSLVQYHPSMNVLGCKWVYKVKLSSDGRVERCKSRLVAKGFHQVEGIDFNETFSPVVRESTIRILLTIAVSNGWSIRQLDVSNAFLHGDLTETVYIQQPPGYVDPTRPKHVYKLIKSIYGLKQAPRAWFEKFSGFLINAGFIMSDSDHSLFFYFSNSEVLLLLLYVDDIILIGSSSCLLSSFVSTLSTSFSMKDLGDLHYFLGMEVTKSNSRNNLLLTQRKYTLQLLEKTTMLECNPSSTPVESGPRVSIHTGELLANPSDYRSIVGALQYLTLTRPDIAFAVNYASQFLHAPTSEHMLLVKRILRYLKSSLGSGITIASGDVTTISGYTDSDWAGSPDSRRSTSGYCVFVGSTLVSWKSKKHATVFKSSTEAEYKALSCLASEVLWTATLLEELNITPSTPHHLFCDNMGDRALALNPVFHSRSKHIELTYHYIRDLVQDEIVDIKFISSALQIANIFTKGLPLPILDGLRDKLMHFCASPDSV